MQGIELTYKPWDHTCGDGCCTSWGTKVEVVIDGVVYGEYDGGDEHNALEKFMEHYFGVRVISQYSYEDLEPFPEDE